MATAKKTYYYVLVFTDEGAKYVTGFGDHNMAYWDTDEKPREVGKKYGEEIAKGLTWNGYSSVLVQSPWEITSHPYNYDEWHIEWKENEVDHDDND